MKAVLPGQPEASLQAVSTGYWDGKRVIVYITGNALAILSDPETILQTIYDNDERKLEAVSFDECSGKIAASTDGTVRIYRPLNHGDDGDTPKVVYSGNELLAVQTQLIVYSGHYKRLSKLVKAQRL